jgi:serine/threonine protein kinase
LKPANIGFDEEGVLKIFDFGLAVELPEESDINSTFNLAGNTGTSRYMAIEVIRKYPYNCKADVFSYSILVSKSVVDLWAMFLEWPVSLQTN